MRKARSNACSWPQRRSIEGIYYPYCSLWEREKAWPPWETNGLEHGLKAHRVTPGGYIEEATDEHPQKKIKAISQRQWRGDEE